MKRRYSIKSYILSLFFFLSLSALGFPIFLSSSSINNLLKPNKKTKKGVGQGFLQLSFFSLTLFPILSYIPIIFLVIIILIFFILILYYYLIYLYYIVFLYLFFFLSFIVLFIVLLLLLLGILLFLHRLARQVQPPRLVPVLTRALLHYTNSL